MNKEIKELSEDQIIALSEFLDLNGYEYDVDYTTLYASKWALCGVRFCSESAYQLAVAFLPSQVVQPSH